MRSGAGRDDKLQAFKSSSGRCGVASALSHEQTVSSPSSFEFSHAGTLREAEVMLGLVSCVALCH